MAHVDQNDGRPLHGSVEGSRGATYYITTDGNGVISCTCIDWVTGRTARGRPIAERTCKHIREVIDGTRTLKAIGGTGGVVKGIEVRKDGPRKLGIKAEE